MKRILPVAIMLILFSAVSTHAGKVILSTYYPAPFGSYDRMKLVPRAALADTYCINKPSNTSMYYTVNRDGEPDSVRYCLDDGTDRGWVPYPGVWTQDHDDEVYLSDTNQGGNLKVGIGTTAPVNILDVSGGMAVGSGYAGTDIAPTDGLIVEGNVGIGTTNPQSALQVVGGHIQLPVYGSIPPATDCDEASEIGRLAIEAWTGATTLWICKFGMSQSTWTPPTMVMCNGVSPTNISQHPESQLQFCLDQGHTLVVNFVITGAGCYNCPKYNGSQWVCGDYGGTTIEIECGGGGWRPL